MRGTLSRRAFTRLGACVLAVPWREGSARAQPPPASPPTSYARVLLATPADEPIRVGALETEEEYLFFYPFVSTPCLLLDLGRPVTATEVPVRGRAGYAWGGGVGPRQSIVAFTAICPHEWTHPERAFSAIGYARSGQGAIVVGGRDRLVVCCAHGSAFDPDVGGRVEQGPAEVPLAAVALSWDPPDDRLFAEGVLGRDSFERFFRAFARRSRAIVVGRAPVVPLREYSAAVARC